MVINHTPGPWRVVDLYEVQAGSLRFRQNYEPGLTDNGDLEHAKDNALLIAAAPDLYEACVEVLEFMGKHHESWAVGDHPWAKMHKAMAKAEGK